TDDIADEIVRLTAAFSPNTTRADMDAFAVVLAEDVADLRPTIYALRRACKQYRAKYRFLGVSDLITEIKFAERVAAKVRYQLLKFPLEEHIADFEEQVPRLLAAAKAEKRRRVAEHGAWRALEANGRAQDFFWVPPGQR